jgi:kynureninase
MPSNNNTPYEYTLEYARSMDANDPLHAFRDQFYIPLVNNKPCIYLTGNSLGLQPRQTQDHVLSELEDWANFGVEGHFHARNPWYSYHEIFPELLTELTGALPHELVVMNQLTVNLHLLMMSFYRPTKQRFKIICEAKAFPSDQYAFQSQVKLHGLDPEQCIIEVHPRQGTAYIEPEDILKAIETHGNETALVIFSGVNYYSGQVFPMKAITEAAHKVGAYCGFDLAHAAGNIRLQLHDWQVDFACWCSYKYLNSGPGGVSGAFVHERHAQNKDLFRLAGWWGHDKETRFKMEKEFIPIPTAEGWQMSNAPVLSMSAHRASLEVFAEAGMEKIWEKGLLLSGYLMFVLDRINAGLETPAIEIITPRANAERGCQVSMRLERNGKAVFEALLNAGVIADWREPDVIRVAPVPLYNTFEDIFQFGKIIEHQLLAHS